MSAPRDDTRWFSVIRDIPEISAVAGNVVMVDNDTSEVWLCAKKTPDTMTKHESSLMAIGGELSPRQPTNLKLMD
jgi:hypothetical protein